MDVLRFLFLIVAAVIRSAWLALRLLGWSASGTSRWLWSVHGRNSRRSGSHGTARFATRWEMLRHGTLLGKGPVLGKGRFGRLLRFTSDGLVMVFAATGAGKGLGIVIPTLLDYRGSMFVTDPKGENYAITRRRRGKFGKVYMLNPTDLVHSERFNPLSIIRAGTPMEADDAGVLARYMHRPDAREAHWDDRAISLLTAFILHVLHGPPELRTLSRVRELSIGQAETMRATLEDIASSSPALKAREIASGFLGTMPKSDAREAGEFGSVLANLQKATEIWSAGSPGGILSSHSTFSLDELVAGTATLYLCVDEELLQVYDRWLRVMTGCMLSTVMRAKNLPRRRRKLILMLDEVAALGPLDVLEKQSGLLRAYCTPVLIWQSMNQALGIYGRDRGQSLLANASARVFFGVNDNITADYVAAMLGNATILSASEGVSQSSDAWLKQNLSNSRSEGGYPLLDPAEVQRLAPRRMIIKLRNLPFPVMTGRLNYRRMPRWWGRWDAWRGPVTATGPAAGQVSASIAAPVPALVPAAPAMPPPDVSGPALPPFRRAAPPGQAPAQP